MKESEDRVSGGERSIEGSVSYDDQVMVDNVKNNDDDDVDDGASILRMGNAENESALGEFNENNDTVGRIFRVGICDGVVIGVAQRSNRSNKDTALSVWNGGVALARFLCSRGVMVRGRNVVELGAGTGIVSLALAESCQPECVIATDLADYLPYIRENAALLPLRAQERIKVRALDWFECLNMDACVAALSGCEPDLIVAADVVWLEELVEPLLCVIGNILASSKRNAGDAAICACACNIGDDSAKIDDYDICSDLGIGGFSSTCSGQNCQNTSDFRSEEEWLAVAGRGAVCYLAYTFRFSNVHRALFRGLSQRFCFGEVENSLLGENGMDADRPRIFRIQQKCSS